MNLIVDIDNTILEYTHYVPFEFGMPKAGAITWLYLQREKGRKVVLHTARSQEEYDALLGHLSRWGILKLVDSVICGKPVGHVYIDDRGLRFTGDWREVEEKLWEIEISGVEAIKP